MMKIKLPSLVSANNVDVTSKVCISFCFSWVAYYHFGHTRLVQCVAQSPAEIVVQSSSSFSCIAEGAYNSAMLEFDGDPGDFTPL